MPCFAVWPEKYWELGSLIGVKWHKGLLISGPHGCGKFSLVRKIASDAKAEICIVKSGDILSDEVGETSIFLSQQFFHIPNMFIQPNLLSATVSRSQFLFLRQESGFEMTT